MVSSWHYLSHQGQAQQVVFNVYVSTVWVTTSIVTLAVNVQSRPGAQKVADLLLRQEELCNTFRYETNYIRVL